MSIKLDDLQIDIVVDASKAETSITKLANSLKKIENAKPNAEPIKKFITEVSKLSTMSTGISQVANALNDLVKVVKKFDLAPKNLASTMGNNIKQSMSAEDALYSPNTQKGLSNFVASIEEIAKQVKVLDDVGRSEIGLSIIVEKLGQLASYASQLKGTAGAISSISKAVSKAGIKSEGTTTTTTTETSNQTASDVTAAGKAVAESTVKAKEGATAFSTLGDKLRSVEEFAKGTAGKMLSFARSLPSNLVKDFANNLLSVAKALPSKAIKGEFNLLKKGAEGLKGAVEKVTGWFKNLFSSIGRIAFYRMVRAAIKMITEAFKEGVTALVNWDAAWGNNTSGAAATLSEIKSYIDLIKRSLGAMAMPIIQVVMPVFRAFANLVISVANTINQIVRAFQGYGTYMKAVYKEVSAVEDATGGATAKAKELQRVIFGFDELNILPKQDDNTGGSGSGVADSGAYDYVETQMSDFFQSLKDLADSGEWEKVGEELGNAFNKIIDDWDSEALGEKIAGKINNGVSLVKGFINTTNWTNLGTTIAGLFNGLFDINTKDIGETIAGLIGGGLDFAGGFLGGLHWDTIGQKFGELLRGAITGLTNWIDSKDWEQVGQDIVDAIDKFFNGGENGEGFNVVETVKVGLKLVWSFAKGAFNFLKGLTDGIAAKIVEYTSDEDWSIMMPDISKEDWIKKWNDGTWGELFNWSDIVSDAEKAFQDIYKFALELIFGPASTFMEKLVESITYIVNPLNWGDGFMQGLKNIWQDAFAETKKGSDEVNEWLTNNPMEARLRLEGDPETIRKKLLEQLKNGEITEIEFNAKIAELNEAVKKAAEDANKAASKEKVSLPTATTDAVGKKGDTKTSTVWGNYNSGTAVLKDNKLIASLNTSNMLGDGTKNTNTLRGNVVSGRSYLKTIAALTVPTQTQNALGDGSTNTTTLRGNVKTGREYLKSLTALTLPTQTQNAIGNSNSDNTTTLYGLKNKGQKLLKGSDWTMTYNTAASDSVIGEGGGTDPNKPTLNSLWYKVRNLLSDPKWYMTYGTSSNTGAVDSMANLFKVIQEYLEEHPLIFSTQVTGSTTISSASNTSDVVGGIYNLKYAAQKAAQGGTFPNIGSLIVAGEAGPEIVANLGSHTGVMNVDQMQEAVAAGNVDVINAIYNMANMVVNAVNSKNLDVYMDASKVGQSVSNYQANQMRRGIMQGA